MVVTVEEFRGWREKEGGGKGGPGMLSTEAVPLDTRLLDYSGPARSGPQDLVLLVAVGNAFAAAESVEVARCRRG
jgi:hypothetical protein